MKPATQQQPQPAKHRKRSKKRSKRNKNRDKERMTVSERFVTWMMVRWTRRKLKWFRRGWTLSKFMVKNPRVRRQTVRGGKSVLRVTGRSLLVLGSTYRVKIAKEFKRNSGRSSEKPLETSSEKPLEKSSERKKSLVGWFEWFKQLVRLK